MIDATLDQAALQALPRAGAGAPPGSHLLGLTTAQLSGRFDATYDAPPALPGAPVCGAARTVRLRLGFDRVTVYIAREATADRCLYDVIYGHETRHVEVDRGVLVDDGPWFENRLRAAIGAIGAVPAGSLEAASDAIQTRIQVAFDAAFARLQAERDRRQARIDTPEEYRRVSQACNGAGARLIARLRPGG